MTRLEGRLKMYDDLPLPVVIVVVIVVIVVVVVGRDQDANQRPPIRFGPLCA